MIGYGALSNRWHKTAGIRERLPIPFMSVLLDSDSMKVIWNDDEV